MNPRRPGPNCATSEARPNMTKLKSEPSFEVTSVVPPVGDLYPFAAGAVIYWFENDRGEEVRHDFGECLGTTKEEAEGKMCAKVLDWMKRQEDAAVASRAPTPCGPRQGARPQIAAGLHR